VQTTLAPGRYYRKASSGAAGSSSTALAPSSTPPQIAQALVRDGMDARAYLGPGRPLAPAIGYSGRPRSTDYPMSVNIATQGRSAWGRPSYEVLKKIIDAYDVARMCVNHKIDELRSMEPMFLPADGAKDDVDDEIAVARLVLAKPDRELPFESWLSKWLENAVKYDSAPLYRRRNYGGDVMALEVVDGKSIHPYIDENGRRPEPGSPAYYQTIHGMVAQWLTTDDLVFEPFRPQEDSPYGLAPIESILLTANTDLRFQWHFLQMFTDGSVPAGFMELPPDISSPEQVAEWQDFWDAMILGDQAKLSQLIAVPNGTKFTETKPRTFDEKFPEYLMSRTCAAFGVVPQDLGLVKDVNRANGETQVDVQFRVNTLPWVRYVEGVLTRYLQQDIGLRVKINLDTGRDKEDRLQEAQAWAIYVQNGFASADEARSELLGLPIDKQRPTPRFFSTPRIGVIPLLAIEGVAGRTDPETFGPREDQPVLDQPYVPPIGVVPTPGTTDDKASLAAVDQYQIQTRRQLQAEGGGKARESDADKASRGTKAEQEQADALAEASDVSEAAGDQDGPAPGEQKPGKQVAKGEVIDGKEAEELAAFRTFVAGRVRKGEWRDFAFYTLAGHIASELNRGGRAEVTAKLVAKAQGSADEKGVPGLTKRSGMISLDLDPGTIPVTPGGVDDHHITIVYLGPDVDDQEFERACQRAQAAASATPGPVEGSVGGLGAFPPSDGSDGKIPAFAEVDVPATQDLYARLKDLSASGRQKYTPHATLAYVNPGEQLPDKVPHTPVRFTHLSVHRGDQVNRYPLGGPNAVTAAEVAKANFTDPKASAGQSPDWPGWALDQEAARFWAPRIAAALLGALDVQLLVEQFEASRNKDDREQHEDEQTMQAIARVWLAQYLARLIAALRGAIEGVYIDGYLIGAASAHALLDRLQSGRDDLAAGLGSWTPGDEEAARLLLGQWGDGDGLRALLAESDVLIKSIAESRLDELGRILGSGAQAGLDPAAIAEQIRALLLNPSRALMIATTELSRAISKAAENRYKRAGYLATRWLTEGDTKVCPICIENERRGAVAIGQPFPSGDLRPPAHPWDRCVCVPASTEE
jgi:2'-5' RNA ligase/phage portal protein BeeE